MKRYTEEQLSILRSASKAPIVIDDPHTVKGLAPYTLLKNDCLIYCSYDNSLVGRPYCAYITEEGKAYLANLDFEEIKYSSEKRTTNIHWWITTVIALYGAIVASIPFIKAFFLSNN